MHDDVVAKKGRLAVADLIDLALAVALPLSTQIAEWTGRGRREEDRARETEGPVTPANGAFVIWAPIFASLIAYGVQKARATGTIRDKTAVNLVRTSLLGNILWSINSQFRDFGWPSVAIIAASALSATGAVARYERLGKADPSARGAANLIGPLAGWLSVATFANVETTQKFTQSRSRSWLIPRAIISIAAIAAMGGVMATRANAFYTAAAGWGLGGIAVKNARKDQKLASIAAIGLLGLSATAMLARRVR